LSVCTGECHISPAVLASMWKEEETKCKNLEEKMKGMIKGRGVCTGKTVFFIYNLMYFIYYVKWFQFCYCSSGRFGLICLWSVERSVEVPTAKKLWG